MVIQTPRIYWEKKSKRLLLSSIKCQAQRTSRMQTGRLFIVMFWDLQIARKVESKQEAREAQHNYRLRGIFNVLELPSAIPLRDRLGSLLHARCTLCSSTKQ